MHGQQVDRKKLNITDYQGNANQNYKCGTTSPQQEQLLSRTLMTNSGETMEKGNLAHCGQEQKSVQSLGRQCGGPQKCKNRATPATPLLGCYITKGNEISMSKRLLHSREYCSTIHSSGNNLSVYHWMNG